MTTRDTAAQSEGQGAMSRFGDGAKLAESLRFQHDSVGQSCPQHCPRPDDAASVLGEPLSIRLVAELIGCSAWTVRHRHIPAGLPHFRSGPSGKLFFYRNQLVRWILQQQKKGTGSPRTGLRPWGGKGGM
jgi:hypothetical protein